MRVQGVKTKNAKMYRHILTPDDTYRRRDELKDQIHKMAPTKKKKKTSENKKCSCYENLT